MIDIADFDPDKGRMDKVGGWHEKERTIDSGERKDIEIGGGIGGMHLDTDPQP